MLCESNEGAYLAFFFRIDCGPSIGMGHAVRCLAIASELLKRGAHCTLVYSSASSDNLPRHMLQEVSTLEIPDDKELWQIALGHDLSRRAVLVVDHYGAARDNLSANVFKDTRKILIDDFATETDLPCDILINPNTRLEKAPSECRQYFLGPKYAPIREEIRKLAGEWRPSLGADEPDLCIISIGATDPLNLTSFILEALARYPERQNFRFAVVLSSAAPHLDEVKTLCVKLASELMVEIIEDVKRMGVLYRKAHCCIGGAGSSAWERCCVGLPTAQLVVADNQQGIQNELVRAGAVANLPRPDDRQFSGALYRFLSSATERDESFLRLSELGQQIVDGAGAERVAQALTHGFKL